MGISIDEVRRVADLARLELSEQELERYSQQLNQILEHVERLRQVDTKEVETDLGAPASEADLRPDVPLPCLDPLEALANAPDTAHGYFKVPRVIG
jgi:aspartyl-tRNA(Asn)/glutamyl-tRNA(Gln) amidotransferase subunit C